MRSKVARDGNPRCGVERLTWTAPPGLCNNTDKEKGAVAMGSKDELRRIIDGMDDRWVDDVLDYVRWLQRDTDTLTPAEWQCVKQGEQELAQGERINLRDWRRQHDV